MPKYGAGIRGYLDSRRALCLFLPHNFTTRWQNTEFCFQFHRVVPWHQDAGLYRLKLRGKCKGQCQFFFPGRVVVSQTLSILPLLFSKQCALVIFFRDMSSSLWNCKELSHFVSIPGVSLPRFVHPCFFAGLKQVYFM